MLRSARRRDFSEEEALTEPRCPLSTQVGTVTLNLNFSPLFGFAAQGHLVAPVYNLTTNPGKLERLGFFALTFGVEGTVTVRPGDYGGRVAFQNIHEDLLQGASVTVWGVPSAAIHNPCAVWSAVGLNGTGSCEYATETESFIPVSVGGMSSTSPLIPYFTNVDPVHRPAAAGHAVRGVLAGTRTPRHRAHRLRPTLTGCEQLEFGPYITAAPDTNRADTPAGFTFDVKMPQEGLTNAGGLSSSDIENTVATLPAGVAINPGQAAGLGACQSSEDGIGVRWSAVVPVGLESRRSRSRNAAGPASAERLGVPAGVQPAGSQAAGGPGKPESKGCT